MGESKGASIRCKALLERINGLPSSKINHACKSTLFRLVNSELNSLSFPSSSLCSNVGYFEAIVYILEQPWITRVSRVCKPIPLSITTQMEKSDSQCETVHIDIVCCLHNSPTWFIVSDRNPKYITWDSLGRNKGLKLRIEEIVRVAQMSHALKPASIILFFGNGLEGVIQEKLKNFGFRESNLDFSEFEFVFSDALDGEWVNVIGKSYKDACTFVMDIDQCEKPSQSIDSLVDMLSSSSVNEEIVERCDELSLGFSFHNLLMKMKKWPLDVKDLQSCEREGFLGNDLVNFDTTALVAIVSGISNGGAENILAKSEDELRERFKNNVEFVISQALSEIESPIYDDLHSLLSGKKGIACQTVISEFMELVSMFGGSKEQMRANQLIKFLKVVPDSSSKRMKSLPDTRKLALKNKVVFGTGDYWGAPTLSANMGFVRAVSQTGMSLFTLAHRPHALVGD